jgi:tryptophan 2,3-dioxygenase
MLSAMKRDLPNYWDYLRLPALLDLQAGLESDEARVSPDELHFIIVHQVFELWFKLLLNELRLAREHLARDRVPEEDIPHVVHHLGRVTEILRQAVGHFSLVETLSPQDFLAFRDRLFGASGFQSVQMREIEILLGLEEVRRQESLGEDAGTVVTALERHAEHLASGPWVVDRLERARAELSLKGALQRWLFRTPIDASTVDQADDRERVAAFTDAFLAAWERHHRETLRELGGRGADVAALERRIEGGLAAARAFLSAGDVEGVERWPLQRARAGLLFIESYRDLPLLSWPRRLVDRMVELEEQLLLWRFRHARMVECVIGRRPGTGGSAGVEYLDRTTKHRIFTDLWTVRTLLLPREALPPLAHPGYYDYALWR